MGKNHWQQPENNLNIQVNLNILPEYFSVNLHFKFKNQEVTKTVKKMTFSLIQKK